MLFWYRNGACSNNGRTHRQTFTTVQPGGATLALLCFVAPAAQAQDVPPGMQATFDITQRLEFSDNPGLDADGDSDFYGRTVLGFGLQSITKVQSFAFNLGTDIEEFQDDNDDDIDITNSFATLNYTRNTRNALFGLNLSYRESDTDSEFFDDDIDQDGGIITQDDGTLVSFGYGLRAAVGQEAPIGASFDWNYNELEYKDTSDPDLNDSTRNNFSGQVDFALSPRISTSLVGTYDDFDTEDPTGTDRESKGLGLDTSLEVSPILTADIGLSYDRIERTGGTNRTDEGVSGSIGLTRALSNGSIGISYESDVFANDDGRRSFFSVSRDMELPRGALSFSLGATGSDALGTDPLVEADYRHDLPTGLITLGLSQRVVVDEDDNEEINTSLRAAFDQEINAVSGYGINFAFFDRNVLDDAGDDGQRYDIGLTYRHELTRDWGLVSGISYTHTSEDNDDDRDRTTVFIGLQRSFDWTP